MRQDRITERSVTNDSIAEKTKERWKGKSMYEQLPHSLDKKLADNEQPY
jgi:hypothetical protein